MIYIRTKANESPAWLKGHAAKHEERQLGRDIFKYLGTFISLAVLMFFFNSFSHGTQDL